MAGFFDRVKERFTQNAAGTTDLSQLSEAQQQLLRRQFIGRLGTSLAQTGDFGAGMAEQASIADQQRAQMQAEALQRRRAGVFDAMLGAGGEPAPVRNEAQASLAAPALLRAPQQSPAAPQVEGAAPTGGGAPVQSRAAEGVPPDLREKLKRGVLELQALGDTAGAKQLLDYAKQFAPLETWFAPTEYFDPVTRETRLGQFSNMGGRQLTDTQAAPTEKVRSLQAMQQDPTLFGMEAQLRQLGASRSVVNMPFERAFDSKLGAEQAKMLSGWQQQAVTAQDTLAQLGELENLLSQARTGATPEIIAQIGRYVGAPSASTLEAVQAAATPFVLSRMQQLGGGDSNEELRAIRASLPGFGISPQANEIILGAMRRAAQRAIQNYQDADSYARTPGNIGLRGYIPLVRPVQDFGEQDAPPADARAVNASRRQRYGLE